MMQKRSCDWNRLGDENTLAVGFDNSCEDAKKYIGAYFNGPYESAYRKRFRSKEEPDSRTLTDLFNEIQRK